MIRTPGRYVSTARAAACYRLLPRRPHLQLTPSKEGRDLVEIRDVQKDRTTHLQSHPAIFSWPFALADARPRVEQRTETRAGETLAIGTPKLFNIGFAPALAAGATDRPEPSFILKPGTGRRPVQFQSGSEEPDVLRSGPQ